MRVFSTQSRIDAEMVKLAKQSGRAEALQSIINAVERTPTRYCDELIEATGKIKACKERIRSLQEGPQDRGIDVDNLGVIIAAGFIMLIPIGAAIYTIFRGTQP